MRATKNFGVLSDKEIAEANYREAGLIQGGKN